MQILATMNQFMAPKSVALVGISRDTSEWAFNILEHLLSYGYQGKIYPINPNASEILGLKAYSSITDVTDEIDQAVITTPRTLVPRLVKQCGEHGIHAITIVAQGFDDASDSQGKQLQREINDILKSSQIRILGPNTLGTANAYINFSSSFINIKLKKNSIGLICQTGIFYVGFPEASLIGKGLDLGNACDIGFVEGLQYFENDPDTKAIALQVEGAKDARGLISTARRTAQKKPLVVLKTGKSHHAARAAQSHTGSLIGSHEIWSAALKQPGIIQAKDLEELVDLTRAFSILPLMENPKVGVATISGALGIIALDGCQNSEIEVSELSSKTKKRLEAMSPSWLKVGNPIDIWPSIMTSQSAIKSLIDNLEIILSDRQFGAMAFIGAAFDEKWAGGLCQALNELAVAHQDKPISACIYGPYGDETIKKIQDAGKVAAFPTPERAMRALARLNEYSQLRRL